MRWSSLVASLLASLLLGGCYASHSEDPAAMDGDGGGPCCVEGEYIVVVDGDAESLWMNTCTLPYPTCTWNGRERSCSLAHGSLLVDTDIGALELHGGSSCAYERAVLADEMGEREVGIVPRGG